VDICLTALINPGENILSPRSMLYSRCSFERWYDSIAYDFDEHREIAAIRRQYVFLQID